jgi:hypothetical protein
VRASDLLFHPLGHEQRLVPQLRETAAWIASVGRLTDCILSKLC